MVGAEQRKAIQKQVERLIAIYGAVEPYDVLIPYVDATNDIISKFLDSFGVEYDAIIAAYHAKDISAELRKIGNTKAFWYNPLQTDIATDLLSYVREPSRERTLAIMSKYLWWISIGDKYKEFADFNFWLMSKALKAVESVNDLPFTKASVGILFITLHEISHRLIDARDSVELLLKGTRAEHTWNETDQKTNTEFACDFFAFSLMLQSKTLLNSLSCSNQDLAEVALLVTLQPYVFSYFVCLRDILVDKGHNVNELDDKLRELQVALNTRCKLFIYAIKVSINSQIANDIDMQALCEFCRTVTGGFIGEMGNVVNDMKAFVTEYNELPSISLPNSMPKRAKGPVYRIWINNKAV